MGTATCVVKIPGTTDTTAACPVDAQIMVKPSTVSGGTSSFDTEILGLTLSGGTLPGGFMLRESPSKASLGKHTITNAGSGNFRIGSFFDVFTEISFDGGQTWNESDGTTRLELTAPEIVVKVVPGSELTSGASSIDFGVLLSGRTAKRTIEISNIGSAPLGGLSFSITGANAGDYSIPPPSSAPLTPGGKSTFNITLNATTAGTRTATLHIASSDSDENPFDITLTARVLAPNGDDDNDGITNAQEMALSQNPLFSSNPQAFNPLFSSTDQRTFLRDNGFYLASDVQALNMDVPLLQKLPGTNQFKLIFGLEKSTDLTHFSPFPLTAPQSTINAEGKLEFLFTVPDTASFFRVQAP
jgi:hypothetical protein